MERQLILDYDSGKILARLEKTNRRLVDGVRLRLRAGECTALIGETGSGKTMTALSIMRLLPDNVRMQGGVLLFGGRDLLREKNMRRLLGVEIVYIPQNGWEFLNPSRKIGRQLYDSIKKLDLPRSAWRDTALGALRTAGFDTPQEIMDQFPFQLSGGMAQRVTIALTVCSRARLLIADEPTNGLDQAATESFFRLLRCGFPEAAKLIITHDIAVAALCDRTQVLCGGRTMESGTSDRVLRSPRHPYTKALIAALVENGMVPSPPLRGQKGDCPFYRRCARAGEACLSGLPHRTEGDTEWWCAGL